MLCCVLCSCIPHVFFPADHDLVHRSLAQDARVFLHQLAEPQVAQAGESDYDLPTSRRDANVEKVGTTGMIDHVMSCHAEVGGPDLEPANDPFSEGRRVTAVLDDRRLS